MPLRRALKDDDMNSEEEGEFEIQDDEPAAAVQRGIQRSRSIGSRGGGPSRAARSSGGSSVSSNATSRARSKSNGRSRSSSVGRMATHRQRSRASMASPSKYGRGLRRENSKDPELDVSKRSVLTAVTDDLSDDPSPLPEGDDDSNHHLRQRLSEMTDMAAVPSPSNYRQRKQRLRNRLSNDHLDGVDQITISPCDPGGSKNKKTNAAAAAERMGQLPDLDKQDSELDRQSIHSQAKESIDRQQRREQAALEEVMSLVAKTKKSSRLDASDRSSLSTNRSGIPREMVPQQAPSPGDRSLRRTHSLNVGSSSSSSSNGRKSSSRSVKGSEAEKKERRNMVKSNLGMFVEDDHR